MTIRDLINDIAIRIESSRVAQLVADKAPDIDVQRARNRLRHLKRRGLQVGGEWQTLNREYIAAECRTGPAGQYLHITTAEGPLNYYPDAKHGPFIAFAPLDFKPVFIRAGGARPEGWYIQDLARSTTNTLVLVGGRHQTEQAAATAAARLAPQEVSRG